MMASALLAPLGVAAMMPWMDASQPIDTRVAALLARMTNVEKQAQTIHLTGGITALVQEHYGSTGLGAFPGMGCATPSSIAKQNAMQTYFLNHSRLSIPVTFHFETLHSGGCGSTIFPMPCLQGATWDAPLVHEVGRTVGSEASANGADRGFSPEINVCTDPRFGRTEENFGEDPTLVATMGVAAVTGLHGGNTDGPSAYLPSGAIVSEAKHAAAYGYGGKDGAAADLSLRTLHDVYLKPWREYFKNGGRGAMMSHNSINYVPAHADGGLMDQLRGWAKSDGILVASDMCDVGLLAFPGSADKPSTKGFGVAANLSAAGTMSMRAGMDQELCDPIDDRGMTFQLMAQAVKDKALPQASLDRAASNVLRSKFAAGLFDHPIIDASQTVTINTPNSRALAQKVAAEGAVLLQNAGGPRGLPLPKALKTVAIIGSVANDTQSQCGGYTNFGAEVETVLTAAQAALPGTTILFAKGALPTGNDTTGFAEALEIAEQADAVVFVAGDSGAKGWNRNTCGEDDDRTQLDLPGVQPELLAAVVAKLSGSSKPLTVVLIHGRPVTFVRHDLLPKLPSVLAAWRPGQMGGPAIWDLLLGKVSPSGRLTQAWPRSAGYVHSQASPWFHKRQGDFDEEAYRGGNSQQNGQKQVYPWGPLFPFGHGLSFGHTKLVLTGSTSHTGLTVADTLNVTVRVINSGPVASKTVAALYWSKPLSSFVRWHKMLGAFAKTPLPVAANGGTAELTLSLPIAAMSSYDGKSGTQQVEPGEYVLHLQQDSVVEEGHLAVTVVA